MEIKNQKLKLSHTSSNLKKYNKHNKQQNEIKTNSKNNIISNTNSIVNLNKNNNNNKLLKLTHSNNIFSIEKDKVKNNAKQYYEIKNNKLILRIEEKKGNEKIRQNSFTGLTKTEDCQQNFSNKNISINKKSFIGKINNFSPFKAKMKKDISINNENINNNIKKNNNRDIHNKSNNKNNQYKTLIKVKENKKKFTRAFSGYGVKRKLSMSNNKNIFNINQKPKNNFSYNKKKELTNLKNNIQNNNNQNAHISNNNILNYNENDKSKNLLSKSAKKCKIKSYLNNTIVKSSKIDEYNNPINEYNEKNPLVNISYQNNNEIIMNKTGNNFYENKIKRKFFNENINNNVNNNTTSNINKNSINKTDNIINNNLKDTEINNKNILKSDNNSIVNNIINIKVKIINKIMPVNSIRDKKSLDERNNKEEIKANKNINKKNIIIPLNGNNINNQNSNNNDTINKRKDTKNHKNNSAKYSKNKVKKIKNNTESKSQNKSNKVNLEKHYDNNCNSIKKSYNLNYKNFPSDKITNKIEKEKSKGNDKDSQIKTKNKATIYNNDFSTISHRANNIKGQSLSTIKANKTINSNVVKYSNIDCIKKGFIEDLLTINEKDENNKTIIPTDYSFIINIISNWGNKKQVGITEIEIFDYNNKKIKINNIKVKGGEGNGIENTNKLYNNKAHTIDENEMWVIDLIKNDNNSQSLNIYLYIYTNIGKKNTFDKINYILIWNYNGFETSKGVKKIEILKNESIYFTGIIPRGDHTLSTEHFYKIKLWKIDVAKRNENQIVNNLNVNYKNNNIKIQKLNNERGRSFDCNNISCNNSVSNKNLKYNKMIRKNEDKNERNRNFSFLKDSAKMKSDIDFNSLIVSLKKHFSSSRSSNKDKNNNSYLNNYYTEKSNIFKNIQKNTMNNSYIFDNNNCSYLMNLKCNLDDYMIINNEDSAIKNIIIRNKIYSMKNQSFDHKKNCKTMKNKELSGKFLTNIKSIKFNNNIQNINIFNSLRSDEQNEKNFFYSTNTLRVRPFNSIIAQNNIPFMSFKKLRINILSNYGNQLSVGLTGISLIDNNLNVIDYEAISSIGALPKDLRTVYENEDDFRIFENLFNGENKTIDENNMWLTLINHEPYIEICFNEYINLSKIEIWNYNNPLHLDNCVKEIEIIFDEDEENKKFNLFLWKGLGIDFFNYFQTIKCDQNYLRKLSNKYNKLKEEINLINLPTGFIFKIVLISNYGDGQKISLKKIEIYNEKSEKLNKYNKIDDTNYTINIKDRIINDSLVEDYFYYHEFYDYHKDKDSICNNIIYICFDEIVQIKYLKIVNTEDERFKQTSAKEIQIYCDDILLFEGKLRQTGENIINFENKNSDALKSKNDEELSKSNYDSYLEIIKDGIYRFVLVK